MFVVEYSPLDRPYRTSFQTRSIAINSKIFITIICLGLTSWALSEPTGAQDSVSNLLENSDFTVISRETSYFSFTPGGFDVIYCGKRGVTSINAETRRETALLESPLPEQYLWAWMSPNKKLLLIVTRKGELVLADVDTKKTSVLLEKVPQGFKRCVFSPDGTYFLAIGGMNDSKLLYWALDDDKATIQTSGESLIADGNTLFDGVFSHDGKMFVTVSGSGSVDFWSRTPVHLMREGTKVTRNGGLSGLAFSDDGNTIAVSASVEPTITLIAAESGDVAGHIEWKKTHPLSSRKLTFLPPSKVLATADGEEVGFLDTGTGQSISRVSAGGTVGSLHVYPDGRWLVAGTRVKSIVAWRLKN